MFDKSFYERLIIWRDLRNAVETSEDPFGLVKDFWHKAPLVNIATDPYDSSAWPDPWEMIQQNEYCEFMKILAIFYTLQLTDRFSLSSFEIHIVLDKEESVLRYLLLVDSQTIGYYNVDKAVAEKSNIICQKQHSILPTY